MIHILLLRDNYKNILELIMITLFNDNMFIYIWYNKYYKALLIKKKLAFSINTQNYNKGVSLMVEQRLYTSKMRVRFFHFLKSYLIFIYFSSEFM